MIQDEDRTATYSAVESAMQGAAAKRRWVEDERIAKWPERLRPQPERDDLIVQREGVCGGDAHVKGTRITVWVLEKWRRMGCSDRDILKMYPNLSAQALKAVWEYATAHKDEIDEQIAEHEDD